MITRPKPSAVLFAKDIELLARFYAEVAELTEALRDEHHIVLHDADFELVIHGIPEHIAATIRITTPPEIREDTQIKICLPVTSIEQARSKAGQLGGRIFPKAKEWVARGSRACDGSDPEGNVFQVRESVA